MQSKRLVIQCLWTMTIFVLVTGRIHKLEIRKDVRRYISLSTFGFYKGGTLDVNLTNFKAEPFDENAVFGFSLDRTLSDAMNPYLDSHQERCVLQDISSVKPDFEQRNDSAVIYFTMDLKNNVLRVNCSRNVHTAHIYKDSSKILIFREKRDSFPNRFSDAVLFPRRKRYTPYDIERLNTEDEYESRSESSACSLNLSMTVQIVKGERYYNTSFAMYVASEEEEGLYNLHFHNCPNYKYDSQVALDFTIQISEINSGNFLSAGEMPLPALYFMMALLFFLSGCFWVYILKKSKHPVFKIHYLMAVLVYLKSMSLLFHGINYHFIQTKGEHVAAWAILYYITHLLKGAVLFITIVLIGTGWTFIKHILADKDKKLFMIAIPLQVLANVAEIIIEESEEGDIEYKTWRDVFILVDLLCCGAIIFPVVWSIKHVEEAAHIDGKAAVNLRKLKLFKHFYIMIFSYIYFTRIIVYLLKITVPFQYEWLDEMFREMSTYVFFVLTGYKFRAASANPYFTLTNDEIQADEDDEMDVVVSGGSGITEGLSKVSKVPKVLRPVTSDIPSTQEERDCLFNKTEASHDYH
ncbi:protein GPR107 isoform X2 [Apis mellifera]|uniref:Protein GPR107 isoform X2 n=2 Tax=Apis TaxID=7459 RepID=A0A7M7LKL0_APIME|nr:protein GPR107 isoform X2 [Apis mellifera]XP_006568617.2 protein GPR107 isoform X2 [Apis mellifera]|eukprot:XP_001121399.3 protein GPR107 isoform X2 [Apis mellifera]